MRNIQKTCIFLKILFYIFLLWYYLKKPVGHLYLVLFFFHDSLGRKSMFAIRSIRSLFVCILHLSMFEMIFWCIQCSTSSVYVSSLDNFAFSPKNPTHMSLSFALSPFSLSVLSPAFFYALCCSGALSVDSCSLRGRIWLSPVDKDCLCSCYPEMFLCW